MASNGEFSSEFFVTLNSSKCKELFSENKPYKFKIKLAEPLNLKQDEWAVALSQISYFNSVYLFQSEDTESRKIIIHLLDDDLEITTEAFRSFPINPTNIQETITSLNKVLEDINESLLKKIDWAFEIVLYNDTYSASFELLNKESKYANRKFKIFFPKRLLKVLGWSENHYFDNSRKHDEAHVSHGWHRLSSHMLILSDISKNQIISDRKAPLLRTIGITSKKPVTSSKGSKSACINHIFEKLHFSDIINEYISTIEITIVDESFSYINFVEDNISLVLCFRKKY